MKEITLSAKEYKELLEEIKLMQKEIRRLENVNRDLMKALIVINKTTTEAFNKSCESNKNRVKQEQEQQKEEAN